MTQANQNLTLYQQETRNILCEFRDENGALVDLGSATITWVARSTTGTANALSKTVGAGISVTGTGTFTITLSQADTASLSGTYYHECVVEIGADRDTIFTGTINVHPSLIP